MRRGRDRAAPNSQNLAQVNDTQFVCGVAQNGAATDEFGIHYLVLAAILETPGDEDCYGWVDVFRDRVELVGAGQMQSAVLPFPESGLGSDSVLSADLDNMLLDADGKAEQEQETLDRIKASAT